MIKGITVTLYAQTQTGTDPFGAPIYTESAVEVPNVLVTPMGIQDIRDDQDLYGKMGVYELSIPKGDTHDWENKRISFFGAEWKSYGPVWEYIEANVPLKWNKKVRVESWQGST